MRPKPTPKNPDGILVPRPNGRGALKQGGVHKKSGRLTKEMTELLEAKQRKALALLTQDLDVLHEIATDREADPQKRISAIAELRENSEKKGQQANVTVNNDNRTAQIVLLPQLGVEVHTLESGSQESQELHVDVASQD